MKAGVVSAIIGGGVVLFLMGALWTTIFPPTLSWTDEKAKRALEVKNKIHNLAFAVHNPKPNLQKGQDAGQVKAEYDALIKENDELNAAFSSATETPQTVGSVIKWSGAALAAIGIIGWYAVNNSG
jgi:hypothetical protein